MSGVKAARYLLANNVALTAVVPETKIVAGLIEQGTVLPAIAVSHVSTTRQRMIASPGVELYTSRVQVTVMATSYPQQKQIIGLVKAALPRMRGVVNDVNVDSLLFELAGPDFRDDDIRAFMGSLDYIITHSE